MKSQSQLISRYISNRLPKPIGPYSVANIINYQGFKAIYSSGVLALKMDKPELVSDNIEEQTKTCFEYIKIIMEENNASMKDIVKVNVYLSDMKEFSKMNNVYQKYFPDNFPARTSVEVSKLPKEAKVEIEVVAYVGNIIPNTRI